MSSGKTFGAVGCRAALAGAGAPELGTASEASSSDDRPAAIADTFDAQLTWLDGLL